MNIEIDMDDNIENAVQHWMDGRMKDLVTEVVIEELKDCDSLKEEVDERLDEALSEHDTVRDLIDRVEELETRMKGLEQERPLDLTDQAKKLEKLIAALKVLW